MTRFESPSLEKSAYTCPHCGAFAEQRHQPVALEAFYRELEVVEGAEWTICAACEKNSVWLQGKLVYPTSSVAPLPNEGMPDEFIGLYNEARDILGRSPSGSAALLRLLIEKLCRKLTGDNKESLDNLIYLLVEQSNLPEEIEQALHSVRIIGNNAVHPGEIDLNVEQDLALSMFELVNLIVEEAIVRKQRIKNLYSRLPARARQGVEDKKRQRTVRNSASKSGINIVSTSK
jgi:hypothetical protein